MGAGMNSGSEAPLSPPQEDDILEVTSAKDDNAMSDLAALFKAAGADKPAEAPPPKRARVAAISTPAAAAPVVDIDDLYGDIAGPSTTKSEKTSTYASKIGSMLNADDFDDDE